MKIENNIIKHYLRNTYFLNGTAYAGKSTMARLLAEKHDMILCGENYHDAVASTVKTRERQSALCYFETMSGWQEFLNRSPAEYMDWLNKCAQEASEIEVAELIRLSCTGKRVVVDTNISPELLHEISDERHVAIMLSPQSMSVERFFDRSDPEKQFLLRQIAAADDPEKTMANFRACIAAANSRAVYDGFLNSGFFTLVRENAERDTRAETLAALERHFDLC